MATFYYQQAKTALWHSLLHVPVVRDSESEWLYQIVAHGPSLLLPWHLLPQQHVFWLVLDILISGSLTVWLASWLTGKKLRHQVAGLEKAAADRHLREAERWEHKLKVFETQAHVKAENTQVKKISTALTRLKNDSKALRDEVRKLRRSS